jgi:hypothetical protein
MESLGPQPKHGVKYDSRLLSFSPESLLRLSQINVTPNTTAGLQYAAAALDATAESQTTHNIDYGKAAALFAFRITLSDGNPNKSSLWFTRSIRHLQEVDKIYGGMHGLRESVATNILEGRSFDYMSLTPLQDSKYSHDDPINSVKDMVSRAHRAYVSAEQKLSVLKHPDDKYDPYAVMVPKFQAIHESLYGDNSRAISIATTGIRRTLHVVQEGDGFENLIKHNRFVAKQLVMASRILAFCIAEPSAHVPALQEKRRQFAIKMFSGERRDK